MLNEVEQQIFTKAFDESRKLGHSDTRATHSANEAVKRYQLGSTARCAVSTAVAVAHIKFRQDNNVALH